MKACSEVHLEIQTLVHVLSTNVHRITTSKLIATFKELKYQKTSKFLIEYLK